MILAIIGLAAFLGVVALVLKLELYSKAKVDLQRAEANLATSKPGDEFDTGAKDGTIVAEFVQDIASQMPVAAALASAEKRDDATFASAAISCIISLLLVAGLAGTLWSFSGALGNRPKNFAKEGGGIDAEAVIKYTDKVHDGLTGAFWPSFGGIVCTVLLFAVRGLLVHPKRDRLFADLERFGHHFTQKLFPPYVGDNATMLLVVNKLETIATALELNSTNLSTAASSTKTAAETLDTAATRISTSNDGFEKTFGTDGVAAKGLAALRETFTLFAKSVKEERKQRKKSEDEWQDAIAKIASHAISQETFAERLEKIATDITAVQVAQTAERDNTLKSINTVIDNLMTTIQAIQSKWEAAQRDMAETIEANSEAQKHERETAQRGIQTIIDNLKTTVQGVEARWETSHRDALAKYSEVIAAAVQKVAGSADRVPEKIEQAKLALNDELLRVQRATTEAHTDFLRRIEEAVKIAVEGTGRVSADVAVQVKGMGNSLEGLTHDVTSLVGAINAVVSQLRFVRDGNPSAAQSEPTTRLTFYQKMTGWVRRKFRRN